MFTKCNHGVDLNKYMGTSKPMYNLASGWTRTLAKNWVRIHQEVSLEDFVKFLDSLYKGESHTERTFGGKLLEYASKLRKQLDPQLIKRWLSGAEGWGEVDSLCQSSFSAAEVLERWNLWKRLLVEMAIDSDVHKRRASLVLLTKPVRDSKDPRLADLAFANVDKLKGEKDILITKAVSWLLRSLVVNHKERAIRYLEENKGSLPKIAVRETTRKLITGKK